MPKESKLELFNLVQSLTKGEKRFFKLYAHTRSAHMENLNYLTLFDAIEKQKEYNEEKIKQLELVRPEHLPMLKNYLYNLILESLRVLRSKSDDIDSKIATYLENARIMRDKGLEDEEIKYILKSRELALKYERWGMALEGLFMERRIRVRKELPAPWREVDSEVGGVMKKLDNLVQYYALSREVKLLVNTSSAARNDHRRTIKKIVTDPLLKNEKKALSLEAQRTRYLTLCNYHSFLEDYESSHKVLSRAMDLVENNLLVFENPDMTYAIGLGNLIIVQFQLRKYEEAFENIQKYRNFAKKPGSARSFASVYSSIFETYYYLRTAEFEKGVICIRNIEKDTASNFKDPEYPAQLNFLHYNIANIYFGARNYRKALQWINTITNQPKTVFREDMQAFARILQILIHYELKDTDILEHLVISAYRFLLKRKQLFGVERSLLQFMRRLSKRNLSQQLLREEFARLRNDLVRITKDPQEKQALEYFDLISWLESKVDGRTFAEVVREKHLAASVA